MKYPNVEINLENIGNNTKKVIKDTSKYGINAACVSKVISGNLQVMTKVVESGIKEIADSRLDNLIVYKDLNVRRLLIRIPMENEINDLVKYCDASLVSEIATIYKISNVALEQDVEFDVILMTDLGDLREGCFYEEELFETAYAAINAPNVNLIGIGANWACYGGVMPTKEKLEELCNRKQAIEEKFNINLSVVSAGSSNCLHLLDSMPECISHLRVGSAIFVGTGLNDHFLDGYHHDNFTLNAQIVELKKKPSLPIGERCLNAFGQEVHFEDKGEIIRAIIAVGRQDVDIEEMIPVDNNVEILGSSSDHIVLEVPEYYRVGDIISFKLTYPGCLKVMTSRYVTKYYK